MAANAQIRWLTYGMFFMFAMTTDSIGVIIPQVLAEYRLNLSLAGSLQTATMTGIALAGFGLGHLADRFSRAFSIRGGLGLFAASAVAMVLATQFAHIQVAIFLAGLGIGIFKTGALALVADMSDNDVAYTSTMNLLEGFFGVGAIVGPLLVTVLAQQALSWRGLYVLAALLCVALLIASVLMRYPTQPVAPSTANASPLQSRLALLKDPLVQVFSLAAFLYVAVECAIYVWMPTLLHTLQNDWLIWAAYTLPTFFVLRAVGRFMGVWAVQRIGWERAIVVAAVLIALCFVAAQWSLRVAAVSLPLSGLFMSILYPTLNSKAIGCVAPSDKGSVAGIILFFTCVGAALGPFAMGAVSDWQQDPQAGFQLATAAAVAFAAWALWNYWKRPANTRLSREAASVDAV